MRDHHARSIGTWTCSGVIGSGYALWSPRVRIRRDQQRNRPCQAIGCESLQVFTHNPRTWKPINHSDAEIAAFRDGAAAAGMGPLVSHGLYLMNLGAPDRDLPSGPPASRDEHPKHLPALGHQPDPAPGDRRAVGPGGVILHVGSFKGSTLDASIERIAAGIAEAFAAAPGACEVYSRTRGCR